VAKHKKPKNRKRKKAEAAGAAASGAIPDEQPAGAETSPRKKAKKKRFTRRRVIIAVASILAGIATVQALLFFVGSRQYPRIPALMALEPKPADVTLAAQRSLCVSSSSLQRNRLERRYVTKLPPEQVQESYRKIAAEQGWAKDDRDDKENEAARSENFEILYKGVHVQLDVVVPKVAQPAADGTYQFLTVVSAPTWKRTCKSGNIPFVDVPSAS
jgi:hypothetical protein